MTLLARTTLRSRRESMQRQKRAETRLDEIVAVAAIDDGYRIIDAPADREVEQAFANVYRLMDDDEERQAVAAAFLVWQKADRLKDSHVHGSSDQAVTVMKANNPFWINGAATPGDSDGAA